MAYHNSLLSSNSSSGLLNLRPNHRSFLIPSPPTTFPSPSTRHRRRRSLIISEMQPSANSESTSSPSHEDIISGGNSLAPTSTNSGQNMQLISLANYTPTWAKLVLGSIVILAIPFCRKALWIKDVTKTVEEVAEVVEMVAEVTEKVAEEIAQVLPNGSLKEAAIRLEKIAFLVDKHAEIAESFITKVEDVVEILDTTLNTQIGGEEEMNDKKEKKKVTTTPTIVAIITTEFKGLQ